jgi:capsid protein
MAVRVKSRIVDADGNRFARTVQTRDLGARYDAAQTATDNERHWSWTDSLSADEANSPTVRKKLRERARYEVANNGWARAMVETLAHEVIGTGPRVQVLTGSKEADDWIERQWLLWANRKVHLGRKFRTMRKAKAQDGEGMALYITNPKFGDVQLDVRPFETEQCTTQQIALAPNQIDGIDLDAQDDPAFYHVLKQHPGSDTGSLGSEEITPPPRASEVIHVFRRDRPGQHRGIPELTPALPLLSKLRRFNLAVLHAAENIANITLALKTAQPDDETFIQDTSGDTQNSPAQYETLDTFDLEKGLVTVLPEDTDLFQPKAEQPTTTHSEYIKTVLAEAFAAVSMPYSVGAADSSDENFASGKLTRLGFKRAVVVERVLDWNPEVVRLFWAWFAEAKFLMPDELRAQVMQPEEWTVEVYWDGIEDIDPEKAARARTEELESGQTSYPTMFAEKGTDWRKEQERMAESLGMTVAEYQRRLANSMLGPDVQQAVTTEQNDNGGSENEEAAEETDAEEAERESANTE